MKNILVAGGISLLLALFGTPLAIKVFTRRGYGQAIRDEGPAGHATKRGTPTMGGTLILAAILIATLLWSDLHNRYVWMLIGVTAAFGAIGFVAVAAALPLWGVGGSDLAFASAMKLMKWYPLLTLPMFIFMGYVLSESRLADDLYHMFHVWMGNVPGGLAIGTIGLMVIISDGVKQAFSTIAPRISVCIAAIT